MRSDRTTQDDKLFSGSAARWVRLDVQDSSSAWDDLTAQRGYDFLETASWKMDHDSPIATATVDLRREIFKLSLAPDVAGSLLNKLGGGSQLLLPNTRMRLYAQLQPSGIQPDPAKWSLVFDGVITKVDSGKDPMSIECSDLTYRLQQKWIEAERAYGVWQPGQRYIGSATVGAVIVPPPNDPTFPNANLPDGAPTGPWFRAQNTGTASANNWIASHSYTAATVTPTIPNGYAYTMTGTHSSGSTEPTWPTTVGGTVTDGAVTWTCVQPTPPVWPNTIGSTVTDNGITWKCVQVSGSSTPTATPLETQIQMVLDDNLGAGAWTLYTPSATGEVVRPYTQSCENVLQAISKLADIIGWDIRYKYDAGTSAFRLTLYDINRSNTTSAYTFSPSVYDPIDSVERDEDQIRNKIAVRYWDGVTVAADGSPIFSEIVVPDATTQSTNPTLYTLATASQTQYGVLYAAVSEGAGAVIGSASSARKMGEAILSDWCMPPINVGIAFDLAWWFEIGDVVTVGADGLHFDSDQTLAVWSLENVCAQGNTRSATRVGLKGRPSTGGLRHVDNLSLPGINGGSVRKLPSVATAAATVTATIAGASITWKRPTSKRYDSTAVHISTAGASFFPSANTLLTTTNAGRHDIAPGGAGSTQTGTIAPGTQYWVKTVHRIRSVHGSGLVQAPPSPGVIVTTGYTNLAHINPNLKQNGQAVLGVDTTFSSSGGDFVVPLTVGYQVISGFFDTTNDLWTYTAVGQVLLQAQADIRGVSTGDAAQIVFQQFRSGSWVDLAPGAGEFSPAISVTGVGTLINCRAAVVVPTTPTIEHRFVIRPKPASGSATWTAKTPLSAGVPGTFVNVQQMLA